MSTIELKTISVIHSQIIKYKIADIKKIFSNMFLLPGNLKFL